MVVQEEIDMEDTQRFLANTSDPVSIEIRDNSQKRIDFNGLSKEEVMKFGSDPKWKHIRWALFILFWIVWIGMLAAAVLIVAFTEKCPPRPVQSWWDREAVYQVDVENFKDSNGDGHGDLKGLQDSLDYFGMIGVKTLCLRGNLLDREKAQDVNALYGTLADVTNLRKALDLRDMHVILDVPQKALMDNGSLDFWLRRYVDGIRVTDYENDEKTAELFKLWNTKVKTIQKEMFKAKLLTFQPASDMLNDANAQVLVKDALLDVNTELLTKPKKFVEKLKELYPRESQSTIFYTLGKYSENGDRIRDRISKDLEPIFHSLALLLKGNPVLLYGDEIRMKKSEKQMKWDTSLNCGFSTSNQTVSKDKDCDESVKDAFAHGSGRTIATLYKDLLKLKEEPSFNWGAIEFGDSSDIITYKREATRFAGYIVAANTKDKAETAHFKKIFSNFPEETKVEFFYSASKHYTNDFEVGKEIKTSDIKLQPGEFLVLKYQN